MALWFSSMASCVGTRGGRVESPIRPFFTQQISSYGRAMGRTSGLFPLILVVCLLGMSRFLLGDFNEGTFEGWVFGSRRGSVSY